jgi:hypothetical protein
MFIPDPDLDFFTLPGSMISGLKGTGFRFPDPDQQNCKKQCDKPAHTHDVYVYIISKNVNVSILCFSRFSLSLKLYKKFNLYLVQLLFSAKLVASGSLLNILLQGVELTNKNRLHLINNEKAMPLF